MSSEKRKVEWSFDFENLGERVSQFFSDLASGEPPLVKSDSLQTPRDQAESASVSIDFSFGKASLNALPASSDSLFEADINYIGDVEFNVDGDSRRSISLRQKGQFPKGLGKIFSDSKDLRWDIALAPDIPLELAVKGGVGTADIDLSSLAVTDIQLETGVGKIALTLPARQETISARVSGGVGKTDIAIPDGTNAKLSISGGVGETNLSLSPNAAVRLKAATGLGKLDLPKSFLRIEGEGHLAGDAGLWESPSFSTAEQQITIEYKGGIGSFQLRFFQLL